MNHVAHHIMRTIALVAAACSPQAAAKLATIPTTASNPVVVGHDGGSASLTIIACPARVAGNEALQEIINAMIQYGSPMAEAESGGAARLTINACPQGQPPPVPNSVSRSH